MNRNFLRGMGTVITLFPIEEEPGFSLPSHSDEEAIRKDWQQVGEDIYDAAKYLSKQKNDKKRFARK